MQKKLTISIDEVVYNGLYKSIGPRKISRFLENLARPLVLEEKSLEASYLAMSKDVKREDEASEWSENLIDSHV